MRNRQPQLDDARWGRDPSGRFDLRWHDGTAWTEHVAIRGAQGRAPLGLPEPQAAAVARQLLDLLPAPAAPPPSRWGPVPPAPTHVPAADAPPSSGYRPWLAADDHLDRPARVEAARSAARARRATVWSSTVT